MSSYRRARDQVFFWTVLWWYGLTALLGWDIYSVRDVPWEIAVMAGFILAAGWYAVTGHIRWHRGREIRQLRRTLITLAGTRRNSLAWLNRDEHLILSAERTGIPLARVWRVIRIGEEALEEVDQVQRDGDGRAYVGYEMFTSDVFSPRVSQAQGMALYGAGNDGVLSLQQPPRPGGSPWARIRRRRKAERAGLLDTSPGELRELIRQFTAAELFRPDQPGE